jgi:hypothetical protein
MSASTRLMAISDCVALDALRVGADLKGIAFISSQLLLLADRVDPGGFLSEKEQGGLGLVLIGGLGYV